MEKPEAIDLPHPYVLCVGTLEPRKNLTRLVRGFVALKQRGLIPHRLVLVGRRGWMVDDLMRLLERQREHVLWLDYLPDAQLRRPMQEPTFWSALRSTKGSVSPCWRPWRSACRC